MFQVKHAWLHLKASLAGAVMLVGSGRSREESYITGANLVVDGGWSAVLRGATVTT